MTARLSALLLAATLMAAGCVATEPGAQRAVTAPIDAETGLPSAALVSRGGVDDKRMIFYRRDAISTAQLAAAPARICAAQNKRVLDSRTRPPVHPDQLPGVTILIVRCAA